MIPSIKIEHSARCRNRENFTLEWLVILLCGLGLGGFGGMGFPGAERRADLIIAQAIDGTFYKYFSNSKKTLTLLLSEFNFKAR